MRNELKCMKHYNAKVTRINIVICIISTGVKILDLLYIYCKLLPMNYFLVLDIAWNEQHFCKYDYLKLTGRNLL